MKAALEAVARHAPRLVAAMTVVATFLALAMALAAPINRQPELWRGPPDEYGHRSAARYYVNHWLPPRIGDPATLDSYSRDYGFSYLNDTDPSYFFAGKFARVLSPIVPDLDRGFRLFNVALLAALALACLLRPGAYALFVPLVLSPQVWYIFSYFNGDAWCLFLAFFIAYQVAYPASLFNRYLDHPGVVRGIGGALLLAVLVALLVLSKKNFLSFAAVVPAAIALRRLGVASALLLAGAAIAGAAWYLHWFRIDAPLSWAVAAAAALALGLAVFAPAGTRRDRARVLAKLAVLGLLAGALALPRHYADAVVNETPEKKQAGVIELQEKLAKPEYKPSSVYQYQPNAFYGMDLRARGTPLRALFEHPWNWHIKTFSTATGSYGWIEFFAPRTYYLAMLAAYLAFLGVYAAGVARWGNATARAGFVIVGAFAALTFAVSIHHSWVNDFQAQGRYLFPVAALLALGLQWAQPFPWPRALFACTAACFALSLYSFVFIGLAQVVGSF